MATGNLMASSGQDLVLTSRTQSVRWTRGPAPLSAFTCAPQTTRYTRFQEVVERQGIVFTRAALDDKSNPMFKVLTTVPFAEQSGQTKQTMGACVIKMTPRPLPTLPGWGTAGRKVWNVLLPT